MRRIHLVLVVLLLSSLACSFLSTPTPAPTRTSLPTEIPATQAPSDTPTPASPGTPVPVTEAPTAAATEEQQTKTPYPTAVLDPQMSRQIDQIQSQVIQLRGLQPSHPVPVALLSPAELSQNVTNDFLVDYTDEEAADDVIELSTIGLLEPGFDLRGLYITLLSEQVAGYYDNDIGEMFIVQGVGFQGPEHMTYAHEYTHVLQDQNYDIKNGLNYNDDACEVDTERCAAIQALIEGDASLSELTWFQNYASSQDQQQIVDYYSSLQSPVYDSSPAFLQDDFVFAYNQGYTFVLYLHDQGGWSAVDAAFRNPPVSTEQILHPELYPSDIPIPVDLPDLLPLLGAGWREISRNQMGEWYTYLILARGANPNARLDDTTAQAAAAGWGGDEYLLYYNHSTNSTAFVIKTVWDTPYDANEFVAAFHQHADIRFAIPGVQQGDTLTWTYEGGYSQLILSGGDTTTWIIAPDAATAQAILGLVQP